jgi:cell division protein FtsA
VARDIERAGLRDVAAGGLVVTGGTCLMHGVPELAEQVFDVPVRRGVPGGVAGLADVVRTPIHATGVGLALYGSRGHRGGGEASDGGRGLWSRVRSWLGEAI